MMKLSFTLIIAALLSNTIYAATLKVGTEPSFAPFEYMDDKTQELTGFDVELVRAVAKAVGHDVEIKSMPFDSLIPNLLTKNIDVAISGMTITKARQRRVSFSDPYYEAGLSVLIRKVDQNKIKSVADLEGKRVCVQIGTTGALYAQQKIKGANVATFNAAPYTFMELQSGNCVAAINDKPVNEHYLNSTKNPYLVALKEKLSTEHYGMAVTKYNKKLVKELNKGLQIIKEDGSYDKLYKKYFGSN